MYVCNYEFTSKGIPRPRSIMLLCMCLLFVVGNGGEDDESWKWHDPYEPAGSVPIAKGSVTKNAAFWRTFVKISLMMDLIKNGYKLFWNKVALAPKSPKTRSPL